MNSSVLYDAPGPRARRRARIGSVLALLVMAGAVYVVVQRLADRGQFEWELWGPWLDPSFEEFPLVWNLVREGAVATLVAAVLSIGLSLFFGVLLGVARMRLGRAARIPLVGFIELFRGLPVVITIVFVWRAFEELDVDLGPLPGGVGLWYLVIGLTLYNSVIIAEILRAGVASLPSGQGEAARAIGMTESQVMRTVLLPQAFRVMLPALISQLVVILKDTSLAALVGSFYIELLSRGNQISQNLDNPIQSLFIVGIMFILINYALSKLATWVERRMSRSYTGSDALTTVDDVVPAT
ncbi:amino acid ABC transporter permease [Nocardioides sp. 1609]|uniref:amino acid ABC transporter permease n=1 Tax=Nocardioides sp. 1609 TaxID=2508327 RepID=UPI00106F6D51|nr:amino acid ABC transporter permease [Nocardioides sp. 1609]